MMAMMFAAKNCNNMRSASERSDLFMGVSGLSEWNLHSRNPRPLAVAPQKGAA